MKNKSDYIFLAILALLTINGLVSAFFSGYILSVNTYLACLCWVVVLLLKIFGPAIGKYGTCILLVAGTFNFLNFGLSKTTFSVGVSGIETPKLDPLILLILIAYYFVNRRSINRLLSALLNWILRGSDVEHEAQKQKKIDFYYKKFADCDIAEFEDIYANLSSYPQEAQVALSQLKAARAVS